MPRPQITTSPTDQQEASTPGKEAQPLLFFYNLRDGGLSKTRADKHGHTPANLELSGSADARHEPYCVLPEALGKCRLVLDEAGCLTKVGPSGGAESLGPGSIMLIAMPGMDFLKKIKARRQHRRITRGKARQLPQRRPRPVTEEEEEDVIVISSDSNDGEDEGRHAQVMAGGAGEAGPGRAPQACSDEGPAAGGSLPPLQQHRGARLNDADVEMADCDVAENEKDSDEDADEAETEEDDEGVDEAEERDKDRDWRPTEGEETNSEGAVPAEGVQPAWTVFNSASCDAWQQSFSTEQVVFAIGSVRGVRRAETNEESTIAAGAKEAGSEKGRAAFAVMFEDVVPVALPRVQLARDLCCLKKDGSHTQHHIGWRLEVPSSRSLLDAYLYYHSTAQALLEKARARRLAGGPGCSAGALWEQAQEAEPFPPFPGGGYEQFLRDHPRGMADWCSLHPRPPRAQKAKGTKRRNGEKRGTGAAAGAAAGGAKREADPGGPSKPRKRPRARGDAEADVSSDGNAGQGGGATEDAARASGAGAAKRVTAEGGPSIPLLPPHLRQRQQGASRRDPASGAGGQAGVAAEPRGDRAGGGDGDGGTGAAAARGPGAAAQAFDAAVCRFMPSSVQDLGPMSQAFAESMAETAKRLGLDNKPPGLYKIVHGTKMRAEPLSVSSDPRDVEINQAVTGWLSNRPVPKHGVLETISDACHPCFNNTWMRGKQQVPQARLVAKGARGRPFLGLYTGRLLLASEDAARTSADVTGEVGLQATVTVGLLSGAATRDLVLVGDRQRSALTCINSANYWGKCANVSGRANSPCTCDVYKKAMREHNAEFIHCVLKLKNPVDLDAWVPQQGPQQLGDTPTASGGGGAAAASTAGAGTAVRAAAPFSTAGRALVRTQYIPLLPVVATRDDVPDGEEWLLPSGYGADDYYRIVEDNHNHYFYVQELKDSNRELQNQLRSVRLRHRVLLRNTAHQERQLQRQLQEEHAEADRTKQEVSELQRQLQEEQAERDRLREENQDLQRGMQDLAAEQDRLRAENIRLRQHLAAIRKGRAPGDGAEAAPVDGLLREGTSVGPHEVAGAAGHAAAQAVSPFGAPSGEALGPPSVQACPESPQQDARPRQQLPTPITPQQPRTPVQNASGSLSAADRPHAAQAAVTVGAGNGDGGNGGGGSEAGGSGPAATLTDGPPGGLVLPMPTTPPEGISLPTVEVEVEVEAEAEADAAAVAAPVPASSTESPATARKALRQLLTTQDPTLLLLLGPTIDAVRQEIDCKEAEIAVVKADAARQERALQELLEALRAAAAEAEARLQQHVSELQAALRTEGELRNAEVAGRAADAQQHKAQLEEAARAHATQLAQQLAELRAAHEEEMRLQAAQLAQVRAAHRSEIASREERIRLLRDFVEKVVPVMAEQVATGQQVLAADDAALPCKGR